MNRYPNFVAFVLLSLMLMPGSQEAYAQRPEDVRDASSEKVFPELVAGSFRPLLFEANTGQAGGGYDFLLRGNGFTAATRSDGIDLMPSKAPDSSTSALGAVADHIRIQWVGHTAGVRAQGEEESAYRVHYWDLYSPQARLPKSVSSFHRVRYRNIYDKVDLVYHTKGGRLEYDFEIRPDADTERIRFRVDGELAIGVDDEGNLRLGGGKSGILQRRPRAFQRIDGVEREVSARFVARGEREFGFSLGDYDRSHELIVDPVIEKTLFFGGMEGTSVREIRKDAAGNVYFFGYTWGALPGDPSPKEPIASLSGATTLLFGTKVSADLSQALYTVYFPVSADPDIGYRYLMDVTPGGDIGVATQLSKDNYNTEVTVGPYGFARDRNVHWYSAQSYVLRISGNGRVLAFSTILACNGGTRLVGIKADAKENLLVMTSVAGTAFPVVPGALGSTNANPAASEKFLAKLSPTGELVYNARLTELGYGDSMMNVDRFNRLILTGSASADTIPLSANAVRRTFQGNTEGYLVVLSEDGASYDYATYLGGSGGDTAGRTMFDPQGNLYVVLRGTSTDYPTSPNGFQPFPMASSGYSETNQAVLLKLNPNLTQIAYGTYLNLGPVNGYNPLLDSSGSLYLFTTFGNVPYDDSLPRGTTGAMFPTVNEGARTYMGRLSTDGQLLEYASYIPTLPGGIAVFEMLADQRLLIVQSTTSGSYTANSVIPPTDPVGIRSEGAEPASGTVWLGIIDLGNPQHCYVTVSPSDLTIPAAGSTGTLSVSGAPGCPWRVQGNYRSSSNLAYLDITFEPMNGVGNGIIRYNVKENPDSRSRRGFQGEVGISSLRIEQDAATCDEQSLNPSSLTFNASGGGQWVSYATKANCVWNLTSDSPWISFSQDLNQTAYPEWLSNYSSRSFVVNVEPNAFVTRVGTVRVGKLTMAVTQQAGSCSATLSPAQQSVPSDGGTANFQLSATGAGCNWKAHLIGTASLVGSNEGTGSSTIAVIVPKNSTTSARTISLLVASRVATINQSANTCEIALNSSSTTVPHGGGHFWFRVLASGDGCTYQPTPTVGWISIWTHPIFGSGDVAYDVEPNPGNSPRTGYIDVLGKRFEVRQEGGTAQAQITVDSVPSGLAIALNGAVETTPFTIVQDVSKPFNISAPLLLPGAEEGIRWAFSSWSDGGRSTHVVPLSAGSQSLVVTYQKQYLLTVTGVDSGSVNVSPAHSDGFFDAGERVLVTALPASGWHFVNWVSGSTGTQNPVTITMDGPKVIAPNFVPNAGAGYPAVLILEGLPVFHAGNGTQVLEASVTLQSTAAPIPLGPPVVECATAPNLISATINSGATPAMLHLEVNSGVAEALASGQYACVIRVARNDGGTPNPVEISSLVNVQHSSSNGSTIHAAVDGASFQPIPLAPDAIVSLFGENLSGGTEKANTMPLPTTLQSTRLLLRNGGEEWEMPLFYVSESQINALIPGTVPFGQATIRLLRNNTEMATIPIAIEPISPALFTANSSGQGAPAGYYIRSKGDVQVRGELATCPGDGDPCVPLAMNWGANDEDVFLILFGTGFRGFTLLPPEVRANNVAAQANYVGPQGEFVGLDQINVKLPRLLKGTGEGNLSIRHAGRNVNVVRIHY